MSSLCFDHYLAVDRSRKTRPEAHIEQRFMLDRLRGTFQHTSVDDHQRIPFDCDSAERIDENRDLPLLKQIPDLFLVPRTSYASGSDPFDGQLLQQHCL